MKVTDMGIDRHLVDTEIVDKFYESVDDIYSDLSGRDDRRILVHYAGDLNFGFANALTSRIEKMLAEELSSKKVHRRFFSVLVEAIQNIRLHGMTDQERRVPAGVTVYLTENSLECLFTNLIPRASSAKLKSRYDEVNAMSHGELKEKYMEVMMNGSLSEKGGAGLGIITMVMRSRNPGPCRIIPMDEHTSRFEGQICVDLD